MIVGTGQLAKAFKDLEVDNSIIFASGVSNSKCTDANEFLRERKLLSNIISANPDKYLIYFSSCALSCSSYSRNAYYEHKRKMEELIKGAVNSYFIFRLPQVFGELRSHSTLINHIYNSIYKGLEFTVYDQAYRYVLDIGDVKKLVELFIKYSSTSLTVDLANPYRYRVLDIVHIFERLLDKPAVYNLLAKEDQYCIDLSTLEEYMELYKLDLGFGKEYLESKLIEKLSIR